MNVEINWKISLPAALHDSKNLERLVENFKLSFYKVMESRRLTARMLYWYNDSLRQTHTHLLPGRSTIKGKQSLSKDHQQRETHFWNYFHEKNYQLRKYAVSESKKKTGCQPGLIFNDFTPRGLWLVAGLIWQTH